MSKTRCFLRCSVSSHPDIPLPHGEEVILGRGKLTKIKDARCSRQQIKLVSNCNKHSVSVTQVGINSSSANNSVIGVGKTVSVAHKDIIEILSEQFEHTVLFNPPPPLINTNDHKVDLAEDECRKEAFREVYNPNKKRKLSESDSGHKPWFDSGLGKKISDDKDGVEWREVGNGKVLVRMDERVTDSEKIAAFDIDGTIITTMSGKVFPTDINDWKILFSEIPGKLKKLHSDGYKIVFITNQAGIARGKLTVEQFQIKISKILTRLGVPCMVFASIADIGYYRKPRPGIWEWLELTGNGGVVVDRDQSLYCGDAAGRQAGYLPGKKKDFSCSDRLLAANLDLKFYTPEEFFLGHKPTKQYTTPFSPKSLSQTSLLEPSDSSLTPSTPFIALLVGIQGSGKSQIARNMEKKGVVVASNDRSGSREKSLKVADSALKEGKSVVVDNTHVDAEARKQFISLGIKYNVTIRALVMTTSHDHARHNNLFRELTDTSHTRIKEPLFNQYRARYSPPKLDEGFTEIIRVNCIPSFSSKELDSLYNMFLLEK